MRGKLVSCALGLVCSAALIAGCGGSSSGGGSPDVNTAGDIPDNQAYVNYQPPAGGFTIKVPEGWSRLDNGSTVSFTDRLNRIEVTDVPGASAPTIDSVTATTVPMLRTHVPNFVMDKVSVISRHAGDAVLLTYRGDSPADPVTGKVGHDAFERYAFFRNGHEVDLTLSGPQTADNVDPWRTVSDSFTWQ
ncbi:hypothetical protein [Embleya sp. NPDC059237]|uniref:hypothetical protein n=1 Tax=Embleya sp. NPDC059237 TaxID=3346784 RepID=UPI0036BA9272